MKQTNAIANNLSCSFIDGEWSLEGLRRRGKQAVGKPGRWLKSVVRRVLEAFPVAPAQPQRLVDFLLQDAGFRKACTASIHKGETLRYRLFTPMSLMAKVGEPATTWGVPELPTVTALAAWLGIEVRELEWFADCQGREAKTAAGPLRHYRYRWLTSRSGKRRLLEEPKARLKAMQRKILGELLARVPTHEAAHGYRRGRSAVSYAAAHVGRDIVLRMDVTAFFPSVKAARVRRIFEVAGYPTEVAAALTGLCTNVVPGDVYEDAGLSFAERRRLRTAHLPQGAPTSPALANLCAYQLDCRLAGLAAKVGGSYTRYADDMAFSGGEALERSARRFQVAVCKVLLEEGFEINPRKTRFMRRASRQALAGVVVNERVNCKRADFDRLKAILTNCLRQGAATQNRAGVADFKAHLQGRIGQLASLSATRGARLRALFAQIDWQLPVTADQAEAEAVANRGLLPDETSGK